MQVFFFLFSFSFCFSVKKAIRLRGNSSLFYFYFSFTVPLYISPSRSRLLLREGYVLKVLFCFVFLSISIIWLLYVAEIMMHNTMYKLRQ